MAAPREASQANRLRAPLILRSSRIGEGCSFLIQELWLLEKKERVTELARMLGGQSDAARRHAEELLKP